MNKSGERYPCIKVLHCNDVSNFVLFISEGKGIYLYNNNPRASCIGTRCSFLAEHRFRNLTPHLGTTK